MNANTTRVIKKPNGSVIATIKKAIDEKKEIQRQLIESISPEIFQRLKQTNKVAK